MIEDWNPENPYDLGVLEELGYTPAPQPVPGDISPIKLPLPPDTPPKKKCKLSLSLKPSEEDSDSIENCKPNCCLESVILIYKPCA